MSIRVKERLFVDGTTVLILERTSRRSNTGHTGIHYIAASNTHQVCLGRHIIGWSISLDDAIALQAEARQRMEDGTFEPWFADIKSKRRKYNQK